MHLIISHLIWCPRHRQPVFVGPVAARCRAVIAGTCAEHGREMLALAIQLDPIHLGARPCVRATPSDSAALVIQDGKGVTAFSLRREFPT
jgi:REP element-mobilizing transposase RayT